MATIRLDGSRIRDWESFHAVFSEALGFPGFYGRNMDAWIDCLSYLDEPDSGMTKVQVPPGSVLTLHVDRVDELASQAPEQYLSLLECAAFVNWRRTKGGGQPLIALSFCRTASPKAVSQPARAPLQDERTRRSRGAGEIAGFTSR
jgi:hypothetical protein